VPPPSSISTSSHARRYLAILAGGVVLLLAASAAFVYVADPFQVLRPSRGTPDFYGVAQFQIPGIARHYPYDAVVTGTSTSNNFRAADLAAAFGWRALNFSIAGSTIEEQRAILETALATGKTRHVFWGVDPFAFGNGEGRPFPYYLYREPGWRTAQYLLNLGALWHGVSGLVRPEAKRLSLAQWMEKSAWDHQYTYGRAQVLTAWEHRLSVPSARLPETAGLVEQAVEDAMGTLLRANPGVQFRIVLLPYSILYSKLLLEERPAEFDGGCRIAAAIASRVATLGNARVHDFRDERDITHDLDGFKDLVHFSGAVSRRIVADVAADRRRVAAGDAGEACALIRADAAGYRVPLR
jgi:hypothetical protein